MQVHVKGQAKPLVGSTEALVEREATTLVITLEADEELVEAQLRLVPATGPAPSFSSATIATDKGTSQAGTPILTNITWVSADWGATRTLQRVSIASLQNAADLRVRLQIARGSSQWYSPPGPHTFQLVAAPAGQAFTATLPDTVADRVMLEFLGSQMIIQPVQPVTIGAAPTLSFGAKARDVAIHVQGKRQVFAVAGDIAAPIAIPELLASLRAQAVPLAGPTTITLELLAGAAGLVGLDWRFAVDEVQTSFPTPTLEPVTRPSVTLSLPWMGRAEVPLFRRANRQAARARVEGLELALDHVPLRERLIVVPADELLREAVGELLRATLESAQRFELAAAERLIGVSIWARPLAAKLSIKAALHADESGAPAAQPLATTQLELDEPDFGRAGPRWLELEFQAPVDVSAGPVWLVLGCEVGELAWFVARPRPPGLGELRQRRSGGAWLTRSNLDPAGWGLLRVRALQQGPLAAPRVELVLRDRQDAAQTHALELDASGKLVWIPDAPSNADAAGAVVLVVHSTEPSTVSLSQLRLRHRLVAPPPDIQSEHTLDQQPAP